MSETKKKRIDKDAVERDYRLGKFTLRELGEKHGCTHGLVAKWVKQYGWTQDLSAAVKAATNAKLMQVAVTTAVNNGEHQVTNAVLAAAEANTQVVMRHRKWLSDLANDALEARACILTLAASVGDVSDAKKVIEAIEASSRTLKTVIEGQRKAHGLDDPTEKQDDLRELADDELIARIEAMNARSR